MKDHLFLFKYTDISKTEKKEDIDLSLTTIERLLQLKENHKNHNPKYCFTILYNKIQDHMNKKKHPQNELL